MGKKDYFSEQAKQYAAFRPLYPEALYDFLFSHLQGRSCAWDCGTGNGQVAQRLAHTFAKVHATDISSEQLQLAHQLDNIVYTLSPAEKTDFADRQFDLITVAQAIHWFDLKAFYGEVQRTAKTGSLLAVWGYSSPRTNSMIDPLFEHFYSEIVGPYWDDARKMVEDHYANLSFPFKQIPCPEFIIEDHWTLDRFAGYLSSWSATRTYVRVHGIDPVPEFRSKLSSFWRENEVKRVTFPVFMKLGVIEDS